MTKAPIFDVDFMKLCAMKKSSVYFSKDLQCVSQIHLGFIFGWVGKGGLGGMGRGPRQRARAIK